MKERCLGDGQEGQGISDARQSTLQRGQTLAIVALLLVVLVAFLALVIDVGHAYSQKRFLQNAADAGALAGARSLALHEPAGTAEARAQEYAALNGAEGCIPTVAGPEITVVVTRNVDTFFASVIGIHSIAVSARAVAGYSPASSISSPLLIPLVISNSVLLSEEVRAGHTITIWESKPDDGGPWDLFFGARGWLNLTGKSGADELKKLVCHTDGLQMSEDVWILGEDGLKNSVLQAFNECRTHSVVIFPVFDDYCLPGDDRCADMGFHHGNTTGNHVYHISGFIAFWVEQVKDTGNPKCIIGHFVPDYVLPEQEGGGDYDAVSTVRLIR